MVRDPSLASLLAVEMVPALLSLAHAALRACTELAVERERQATARLAIWSSAFRPQLKRPPAGAGDACGDRSEAAAPEDGR